MIMKGFRMGLVVVLALALLISCGGKKEGEKTEETGTGAGREIKVDMSEEQVKMETRSEAATVSQQTGDWRGFPIYPVARLIEKMSVALPLTQDLKDLEYRFFETDDDVVKVATYYQAEMPKRGWTGTFMISDGYSMGNYQKEDGNLIGVIIVDKRQDKTNIMLAVGSAKK